MLSTLRSAAEVIYAQRRVAAWLGARFHLPAAAREDDFRRWRIRALPMRRVCEMPRFNDEPRSLPTANAITTP